MSGRLYVRRERMRIASSLRDALESPLTRGVRFQRTLTTGVARRARPLADSRTRNPADTGQHEPPAPGLARVGADHPTETPWMAASWPSARVAGRTLAKSLFHPKPGNKKPA